MEVVYIYTQVETNKLVHYLELVQKIPDDHDTKPTAQFQHNWHIYLDHQHHVSYTFIVINVKFLILFIMIHCQNNHNQKLPSASAESTPS